mmetsp:Transcript_4208/g.11528  ORF Transcript_4208/g.11528 Transcript_4208/m.11528 type:complete len:220 (-) Transcript_4208:1445-2104(-)
MATLTTHYEWMPTAAQHVYGERIFGKSIELKSRFAGTCSNHFSLFPVCFSKRVRFSVTKVPHGCQQDAMRLKHSVQLRQKRLADSAFSIDSLFACAAQLVLSHAISACAQTLPLGAGQRCGCAQIRFRGFMRNADKLVCGHCGVEQPSQFFPSLAHHHALQSVDRHHRRHRRSEQAFRAALLATHAILSRKRTHSRNQRAERVLLSMLRKRRLLLLLLL